jgi:hypothetical protein
MRFVLIWMYFASSKSADEAACLVQTRFHVGRIKKDHETGAVFTDDSATFNANHPNT